MRTFLLAALFILLSAPAFSQGLNLSHIGEKTHSPAEDQRNQEIDQAYRSATEKIGARVEREPSISPIRAGCTRCSR